VRITVTVRVRVRVRVRVYVENPEKPLLIIANDEDR
jgi:hypothetical protein